MPMSISVSVSISMLCIHVHAPLVCPLKLFLFQVNVEKSSSRCKYLHRQNPQVRENMVANFHCTRRLCHSHMHTSNILQNIVHKEEQKMIQADAFLGRFSTVAILLRLKTNLKRFIYPKGTASVRKSRDPCQGDLLKAEKDIGSQLNH